MLWFMHFGEPFGSIFHQYCPKYYSNISFIPRGPEMDQNWSCAGVTWSKREDEGSPKDYIGRRFQRGPKTDHVILEHRTSGEATSSRLGLAQKYWAIHITQEVWTRGPWLKDIFMIEFLFFQVLHFKTLLCTNCFVLFWCTSW